MPEFLHLGDDTSAGVVSTELPADHWLYASVTGAELVLPAPVLGLEQVDAVRYAARHALRAATLCGSRMDFDPDALVQNLCIALCGYHKVNSETPADKNSDNLWGNP